MLLWTGTNRARQLPTLQRSQRTLTEGLSEGSSCGPDVVKRTSLLRSPVPAEMPHQKFLWDGSQRTPWQDAPGRGARTHPIPSVASDPDHLSSRPVLALTSSVTCWVDEPRCTSVSSSGEWGQKGDLALRVSVGIKGLDSTCKTTGCSVWHESPMNANYWH